MAKNFGDVLISWNEHMAKKYGYEVSRWESSDGIIHYSPNEIKGCPIVSVRVNDPSCPDRVSLTYKDFKDYIEMSFSEEGELKSCYFAPGEEGYPNTIANIVSVLHMLNYFKEESDG